ncbi:hypothetical protein LP420_06350 [Massilia sp. B-10]|nr:hypothetical protein LP420_06350 [Massilia sp. B-10]
MQNAWVALCLRVRPSDGNLGTALHTVFSAPGTLAAIAPLHAVLMLDAPDILTEELLALMPSTRVAFAVNAGALSSDAYRQQLLALHTRGYRILIDGPLPEGASLSGDLRTVAHDFTADAPCARRAAADVRPAPGTWRRHRRPPQPVRARWLRMVRRMTTRSTRSRRPNRTTAARASA